MRALSLLIGLGWFWLLFYGAGPLTSRHEILAGGGVLVGACLVAAALGVFRARR